MSKGAGTGVIIVAAGSGQRFGGELPKQFCMLADMPVVLHSVRRFRELLPAAEITVVVANDRLDYWHELETRYGVTNVKAVAGGSTRWESVKNALSAMPEHLHTVMVHDGARPLVQPDVVERLLDASECADGALPVLPMTDSLRMYGPAGENDSTAVDRSRYCAVQTPQVFNAEKLREAYALPYSPTMTDDASVMEAAGYNNIILCEGSEATLKITRRIDLDVALLYLSK